MLIKNLTITTMCLFLLAAFIISGSTNLYAAGGVTGTVTDAGTGEALYGANVILIGTTLGAATNFDGKYRITQVPAGTYILQASYIGYKDTILTVDIVDGRIVEINLELLLDVLEGEDVIVTAQAQGQLAAINQQLSSNTIKNIVSAEKIREIPDANAAESIGRLPGISILRSGGEANRVVIRGLSPTYNTITIGGERVPSTGLDDRGVDLNMISPEVLAGIEVTKALTADQDADAIGGTVNLRLNDAPSGFRYNFRTTGGYNSHRDEFGQYNGSLTISNRFAGEKFGLMVTANRNRVPRGSDRLTADYDDTGVKAPDGDKILNVQSPSLRYVNEIRERSSFSLFLDYKLPNGKLKFTNFISRLDRDQKTNGINYDLQTNGAMQTVLNDTRTQTDIFTSSLSGEFELNFGDLDFRLSRNSSVSRNPYDHQITFQSSGLDLSDTSGVPKVNRKVEHIVNANNLADVNLKQMALWSGNFNTNESFERDFTGQFNFKTPFTFSNSVSGYVKLGAKYYTKRRERSNHTRVLRSFMFSEDTLIDTYHSRYGDPDFVFQNDRSGNPSVINYLKNESVANFLNGEFDFPLAFDDDELARLLDLYTLDNLYRFYTGAELDDYEVTENVSSAYLMTEINIGNLMLLPGIRYEYTKNDLTGREGRITDDANTGVELIESLISDTSAVNSYGNWFPMIHMRYKPVDWFDVRLAYTKTISRPIMQFMLPKLVRNTARARLTLGSPLLDPQISTNMDLFLSFYGNEIGLFTVGGFYKEIENLIYRRDGNRILSREDEVKEGIDDINFGGPKDPFFRYELRRPENNEATTYVKGLEVEWQTNFHWLPSPFNGIVLNLNYTRIWSETQYPRSRVDVIQGPGGPFDIITVPVDTTRSGKMINQPDDVANITLGYDYGRFSGRVSMVYQGKTLTGVAEFSEEDSFTEQLLRFDLSLKYNITDNISIFLNANNITNRPDESFIDGGTGNPLDHPTSRQFYGYTLDFGIGISN